MRQKGEYATPKKTAPSVFSFNPHPPKRCLGGSKLQCHEVPLVSCDKN